jgi:hypothetical protein
VLDPANVSARRCPHLSRGDGQSFHRVFSVIAMEFALLTALAIGMAGHYRESFGR